MYSELTATERVSRLEQMQEQDANRRRKTVVTAWGSVGIATLVLAVLVFGSVWQLKKIRDQKEEARTKLIEIQNQIETTRVELKNSQAELKRTQEQRAALTQIVSKKAKAQPKEEFEEQVSADPKFALLLPRAYLQIVDPKDREWASAIGRRLEESGIIVPGIELVPKAVRLKRTEVRYYQKSELEGAKKIAALLMSSGVDADLIYLNQENNPNIRPNQFEVWFAAGSRTTLFKTRN